MVEIAFFQNSGYSSQVCIFVTKTLKIDNSDGTTQHNRIDTSVYTHITRACTIDLHFSVFVYAFFVFQFELSSYNH